MLYSAIKRGRGVLISLQEVLSPSDPATFFLFSVVGIRSMSNLGEIEFRSVSSRRQLLLRAIAVAAAGSTGLRSIGVRAQSVGSRVPSNGEAEKYLAAVRDYYVNLFTNQPSIATWFGLQSDDAELHRFLNAPVLKSNDARLETASADDYQKIIRGYKDSLSNLEGLDRKLLGRTDRHDLEALIGRIRGDLLYVDDIKLWQKDPGIYPAIAFTALTYMFLYLDKSHPPMNFEARKERSKEADQRLQDVVSRLEKIPQLLTNGMKNVNIKGRQPKDHPPKALIALAIATSTLSYFEKDLPAEFPGGGSASFKKANKLVIAAVKAYDKHLATLQKGTAARTEMYAIGKENLAKHLTHYECFEVTTSDLDKLLASARELLDAERKEYGILADRLKVKLGIAGGSPSEIVAAVDKKVKETLHADKSELLPASKAQAELLRRFLIEENLVTIPASYPDVEVAGGGGWLLDSPPVLNTLPQPRGVYKLNVPDTSGAELENTLFSEAEVNGMLLTAAHEVWPGHFMQYLVALDQKQQQSLARRLAWTIPGNATAEGWAMYTEQMVIDRGLGPWMAKRDPGMDEDYLRFGQIALALLRTGRLVATLEVHMEKDSMRTVAAVKKFFHESCFQGLALAESEALVASNDGVRPMGYTFGKMMVLKLLEDCKEAMGPKFKIKEFHDTLLSKGSMPLKIIRQEMMGETEDPPVEPTFANMLPMPSAGIKPK